MQKQALRWRNMLAPLAIGAAIVVIVRAEKTLDRPAADPSPASSSVVKHPVIIHQPDGPPMVDTGKVDAVGQPILANCSTCHATRPPNPQITDGSQLTEFHQGLTTDHGGQSCLACHNRDDYRQLRLADGRPLPYAQVMSLCAQCHGPQYRDYQHGSHGGMIGYWDLTKGGRARNNCIDCHDPHAPQYPQVMPVHRPNDRFLRKGEGKEADHE